MSDTKKKHIEPSLRERRPGLFKSVSPERTAKRRARIARQSRLLDRGEAGYIPEAHPTKKLTLGRLWAAGRTPAAKRMRQAQNHYALLVQLLYGQAMRPAATGAISKVWGQYWAGMKERKLAKSRASLKKTSRTELKKQFGIT